MADNPENRVPDCLYLELQGAAIQPEVSKSGWQKLLPQKAVPVKIEQIDLSLTINFNEQWQKLPAGRVKFGLRGGELRLAIANGKIPYHCRELAGSLPVEIEKGREEKTARKAQTGLKASGSVGFPFVSSRASVEGNIAQEQSAGKTDKFQLADCQVTTKGAEDNPAWVFAVRTGEPVLRGLLKQARLGRLEIATPPCQIDASFTISKLDLCLTGAEGIWPADISHNKRAWIERGILLWMLESKLKPYLSRQLLQFPEPEGAAT